jgi:hypothetical protein
MAANENTKFQINYKLADGTLINLYATDVKDLETGLADLGMVASLIKSTASDLGAAATPARAAAPAAAPAPTIAAIASQLGGTVIEGQAPSCSHGVMSFRTGTSARGPWKGWMCAAPKGATDKCSTIWA